MKTIIYSPLFMLAMSALFNGQSGEGELFAQAVAVRSLEASGSGVMHRSHQSHRLGHRHRSSDDLVQQEEGQEAEETFEIVQNKKVFKDDYGKDIVDPDEINEWEN